MSADGRATRQNTFIDIPLDIRLPHFIEDDMIPEEGPLMGNFKLSLQSVICHRGNSLHSGHYVSFVRGAATVADGDSTSTRRLSSSSRPPQYPTDRWIRHDDLAQPDRVQYVDIEQALKDEMPYLLFYQVQPTYEIPLPQGTDCHPPSYDSGIDVRVSESSPLRSAKPDHSYFPSIRDDSTPTFRLSAEIERPRHSINLPDERRGSIAYTDTSVGSTASSFRAPEATSTPATPVEETTVQRISRAASKFAPGSRSRPASSSGENRISSTISRIAMRSKDQLNRGEPKAEARRELAGTTVVTTNTPTIPTTDFTSEPRDAIVTVVEEESTLKPREPIPIRARSKLGIRRDRDKSKEPSDKLERLADGVVHHHQLHKGKGKDVPDRECIIM